MGAVAPKRRKSVVHNVARHLLVPHIAACKPHQIIEILMEKLLKIPFIHTMTVRIFHGTPDYI